MNRNQSLANAVLNEHVWALTPTAFEGMRGAIRSLEDGGTIDPDTSSAPYLAFEAGGRMQRASYAGDARATGGQAKAVAVIPIHGVIFPRGSNDLLRAFGGVSLQETMRVLRRAVADPGIGSVIGDFDTPGGMVAGVPEAAAAIRALRGRKPLVAIANFQMASAGLFLGSQFDSVVASPSSSIGSLGVVAQYFSGARALEMEGLACQTMKFPHLKAEADGIAPLSDEAVAYRMAQIKAAYDAFEEAVSLGRRRPRSLIAEHFGKGRSFDASSALAVGMIDRIQTFDSLLAEHVSADFERVATRRAAVRDAAMLAARWGLEPPAKH